MAKKKKKKEENNNSNLKETPGKLAITLPMERKGFFVDIKDWEYLRKLVKKPIKKIRWIELAIGVFGTTVLSSLFYFLTFPADQSEYRYIPLLVSIFSFFVVFILVFFGIRDKKNSIYQSEKEILDYMRKMEIKEIKEVETKKKK
jgi:amino acid transporter